MKKAAIFVLMGALVSTNALAWGDREQGVLTGMAALWAFQKLNQNSAYQAPQAQPQTVYVERPVIVQPQVVEYQRQYCTPWTETRNWDGTVTRSRTCNY
jgi:hypothetical protein